MTELLGTRRCVQKAVFTLMLSAFTPLKSFATDNVSPRAWLVTKGTSQAVLVGESHFKTTLEFNHYFNSVVKPSFDRSQVALLESYFEEEPNVGFHIIAPCTHAVDDRRTDKLKPAFDALIAATVANELEVPNWMTNWPAIPEYTFVQALFTPFLTSALATNKDGQPLIGFGGVYVSGNLRNSAVAAGQISKLHRLDTFKDRREQFCSASANERQDDLVTRIMQITNLLQLRLKKKTLELENAFDTAMNEVTYATIRCVDQQPTCKLADLFVESSLLVRSGLVSVMDAGTRSISLKKRTHAWVPIIKKAIDEHNKTFVIVGSAHLPDLDFGGKIEPGLITLLRREGFTVSLIRSADDISETFLSKSMIEKIKGLFL